MSVRTSHYYSYKQTGPQTARATYNPKESLATQGKQDKKASFVVQTEPTIAHLAALFGALLDVFRSFDEPAQPRLSAPRQDRPSSSGDMVFTFTGARRTHEAELIAISLFAVLMNFDCNFVDGSTEPAQPPVPSLPRASQLGIEPAPRKATQAPSEPKWHHLPSRAGSEASGLSPSRLRDMQRDAAAVRKSRRLPSEPVMVEAPELAGEKAEVVAERRTEVEAIDTQTAGREDPKVSQDTSNNLRAEQRIHPIDDGTQPTYAAQAPSLAKYDPQALADLYAKHLDLDRRRAEYAQAKSEHDHHAQKNAEEARRSAEEAKGLTEEAAQVQDVLKAQNLKNDAEQLNARAQQFEAAAQAHRDNAREFAEKLANVEDQIEMFTLPAA